MEYFETQCESAVSKEVTKIRVYITRAARAAVEKKKSDSKTWVERCVWRFIALQQEADVVKGEGVEFTLKRTDALQLMSDLEEIDSKRAKS
jgi:hypothetical protein